MGESDQLCEAADPIKVACRGVLTKRHTGCRAVPITLNGCDPRKSIRTGCRRLNITLHSFIDGARARRCRHPSHVAALRAKIYGEYTAKCLVSTASVELFKAKTHGLRLGPWLGHFNLRHGALALALFCPDSFKGSA